MLEVWMSSRSLTPIVHFVYFNRHRLPPEHPTVVLRLLNRLTRTALPMIAIAFLNVFYSAARQSGQKYLMAIFRFCRIAIFL